MRQLKRLLFITVGLAIGAVAANAADLSPGSPAPELEIKTWYKGKPIKSFEAKKVYVVEFWATWCGPCIESIPHITELAKKNKDVTFIGVGIWEDDNGTNVRKFVADMGKKMDYNVGYSGNKTGMAVTWMNASGQNGIPTAFIVKDRKIQWVGHPMNMEKPLAEVKAGTFNLEDFKAKFDAEAEKNREMMAAQKEIKAAMALASSGKYADAKAKLAEIESTYPSVKDQLEGIRFGILSKEDPAAWEAKAKSLAAEKKPQGIEALTSFAVQQTQPGGDLAKGTKAMDLALEAAGDKELFVLYDGAFFFDKAKDYKKALTLVDKMLTLLPSTDFKDNVKFKESLEKMKTDLAAKAKAG